MVVRRKATASTRPSNRFGTLAWQVGQQGAAVRVEANRRAILQEARAEPAEIGTESQPLPESEHAEAVNASPCDSVQYSVHSPSGEGGIRTPSKSPANSALLDQRAAKSGAGGFSAPIDPELAEVMQSWETLPEAIRAGILALVRAAKR
jgi:hypothetical protein